MCFLGLVGQGHAPDMVARGWETTTAVLNNLTQNVLYSEVFT